MEKQARAGRSVRHRNYGPWTPEEEQRLKQYAELGFALREIAQLLQRPSGYVDAYAHKLGVRIKRRCNRAEKAIAQGRQVHADAMRNRELFEAARLRFAGNVADLAELISATRELAVRRSSGQG